MKTDKKHAEILEIQNSLKDSLENWAKILLSCQDKGVNHNFRFNNDDMMNLLIIFQELAHNLAYYKNPLDKKQSIDRAEYFGKQMRDIMINFCCFDPHKHFND